VKFTVERSRWRNAAHGIGNVLLLNEDGYKCCLGFVCEQLGVRSILNRSSPKTLEVPVDDFNHWDVVWGVSHWENTELSKKAILINDDVCLTDQEREAQLIELFKKHGHELIFTGEYDAASASSHD